MDILTAIFGTQAKVRILRLFLFNPETPFFLQEVVERTKRTPKEVSHELSMLIKADLLKKRLTTKEIDGKKVHGLSYQLNQKFVYLSELKSFLTIASMSADDALLKRFSGAGKLKLFIASGVFVQNWESRVDLLIAGDDLDMRRIENAIRSLEAEIGKEIAYSAFETADFEYRLGIHDRLVRDIIDYPHVTLLDRLGVEPS
jgi:hypothetical protein